MGQVLVPQSPLWAARQAQAQREQAELQLLQAVQRRRRMALEARAQSLEARGQELEQAAQSLSPEELRALEPQVTEALRRLQAELLALRMELAVQSRPLAGPVSDLEPAGKLTSLPEPAGPQEPAETSSSPAEPEVPPLA
jgi:hypothetical protein